MVQGEQVTFTIPIYIVNEELTT